VQIYCGVFLPRITVKEGNTGPGLRRSSRLRPPEPDGGFSVSSFNIQAVTVREVRDDLAGWNN